MCHLTPTENLTTAIKIAAYASIKTILAVLCVPFNARRNHNDSDIKVAVAQ
jgi:hypothetical protein